MEARAAEAQEGGPGGKKETHLPRPHSPTVAASPAAVPAALATPAAKQAAV